ncbi:MAG: hypothetical protein WCG66_11365 [bacterium]
MSARRIFLIIAILTSVASALWIRDWTAKRPLPMSGGLYFPVAVKIPGPHFLQGDARWGGDSLAKTSESLADVGCAVASAAMALASRGVDTDPGRLNAFLKNTPGGYSREGWIYWEKAAEVDPERVGRLLPHYEDAPSYFLIDWNLLHGNPVIARVRYPSGVTHFVVICGKQGFDYLVRDPGEGGQAGLSVLSDFPPPVEALRFYRTE